MDHVWTEQVRSHFDHHRSIDRAPDQWALRKRWRGVVESVRVLSMNSIRLIAADDAPRRQMIMMGDCVMKGDAAAATRLFCIRLRLWMENGPSARGGRSMNMTQCGSCWPDSSGPEDATGLPEDGNDAIKTFAARRESCSCCIIDWSNYLITDGAHWSVGIFFIADMPFCFVFVVRSESQETGTACKVFTGNAKNGYPTPRSSFITPHELNGQPEMVVVSCHIGHFDVAFDQFEVRFDQKVSRG